MNFNNSIEGDIIKSVRAQQEQFEQLSKELENEREIIAKQLEEFMKTSNNNDNYRHKVISNDNNYYSSELSDVVSIPSITSTNDDRFWNYETPATTNLELPTNNYKNNNNNNKNIINEIYDKLDSTIGFDIENKEEKQEDNRLKLLTMVDNNIHINGSNGHFNGLNGHHQHSSNNSNNNNNNNNNNNSNPNSKTDHYSYSYSYKTADDAGIPGVSSVEVNESVTEEIGPDGTKIIRRHQQEKQINKVTQVVTQRVIKRQYIDPTTGQIIEFDPLDERFANLPPETVFEEQTIRSNETPPPTATTNLFNHVSTPTSFNINGNTTPSGNTNGGVQQFQQHGTSSASTPTTTTTTTTTSSLNNNDPTKNRIRISTNPATKSPLNLNGTNSIINLNSPKNQQQNYAENMVNLVRKPKYNSTTNTTNYNNPMIVRMEPDFLDNVGGLHLENLDPEKQLLLRKSHPEDNQGYPEERNMDYDPDDITYPEDPQYEGLIPDNQQQSQLNQLQLQQQQQIDLSPKGSPRQNDKKSRKSSATSSSSHHHHHHKASPLAQTTSSFKPNGIHVDPNHSSASLNNSNDYGIPPNYNDPRYVTVNNRLLNNNNNTDNGIITPSTTTYMPQNELIYDTRYSAIQPYDIYDTRFLQQQQQQQFDPYNDNNTYGTFMPINGNYPQQQRVFISRNQLQPQGYLRTRSPSIDSRTREQGWRNPDLEEVIEFLSHPSNEIKANASAYLQHLCYQDDDTKAKTRILGGIPKLINLLSNEILDVHKNACGALRNLSYGRNNDENKVEICKQGGIGALINLLKRTTDEPTKESITAVLWNLSSCEDIKGVILDDGLNSLVKCVILPYSSISAFNTNINNLILRASQINLNSSKISNSRLLNEYQTSYATLLTNATGVLRNCSSNLQFQTCYEARKKLRECDGLINALLRIVDHAVEPYLKTSSNNQQQISDNLAQQNIDSKCVENAMCILRNLSFRLQEIIDPNYDREVKPMPIIDEKSKSSKKKKNIEEEFLKTTYPYNMIVPFENKPVELLWDLTTLSKYLIIIKESTIRDTIEASVGCLQNLTACYWKPSMSIRQEIRKLKGLPTIVFLLQSDKPEDEPIVSVTAIALRNLAIDAKNRELIGKYAMKDLVSKLPDPKKPIPRLSILNEDTITASLACINECIKTNDDFVKSCYNEGGVARMVFITRNGQFFPNKIVKYAAHVLFSIWKHKNLHDFLRKDNFKEIDYVAAAKQMGIKSQSSSPANTLHRPRGDVNSKPTLHSSMNKSKRKQPQQQQHHNNGNSATNLNDKNSLKIISQTIINNATSNTNNHLANNQTIVNNSNSALDVPIYSQVIKPPPQSTTTTANNSLSNRSLVITNGSTNADSWV